MDPEDLLFLFLSHVFAGVTAISLKEGGLCYDEGERHVCQPYEMHGFCRIIAKEMGFCVYRKRRQNELTRAKEKIMKQLNFQSKRNRPSSQKLCEQC